MARTDLPNAPADSINAVCTWCDSPELFCACPDDWKRVIESWD